MHAQIRWIGGLIHALRTSGYEEFLSKDWGIHQSRKPGEMKNRDEFSMTIVVVGAYLLKEFRRANA